MKKLFICFSIFIFICFIFGCEIANSETSSTIIPFVSRSSFIVGEDIVLKKVIVEIGTWNMNLNSSIIINCPVSVDKIISSNVFIKNDLGTGAYPIYMSNSSGISCGAFYIFHSNGIYIPIGDYIEITRYSCFTGSSYDSTIINRGWITIEYTE